MFCCGTKSKPPHFPVLCGGEYSEVRIIIVHYCVSPVPCLSDPKLLSPCYLFALIPVFYYWIYCITAFRLETNTQVNTAAGSWGGG